MKIFSYLDRYYLSDLKVRKKIKTFRIICYDNLKQNRKKGSYLPYTLTILPCFLVPYSLVPINLIFDSIKHFLTFRTSLKEAAMMMHCSSSMSFKLYLLRCQRKIKDWIIFIIQLLLSINGVYDNEQIKEIRNNDTDFKDHWETFNKHLNAYLIHFSRLPDSIMITDELKYPYIHNHCCFVQLGLGP